MKFPKALITIIGLLILGYAITVLFTALFLKQDCGEDMRCLTNAMRPYCEEVKLYRSVGGGVFTERAETTRVNDKCRLDVIKYDSNGSKIKEVHCVFNIPVRKSFSGSEYSTYQPYWPSELCEYADAWR